MINCYDAFVNDTLVLILLMGKKPTVCSYNETKGFTYTLSR